MDTNLKGKKLYKSNKNKMIDGVCAGIGEYFDIDPTLVRLAFVILCVFAGGGILAYIVALIIIPRAPEGYDPAAEAKTEPKTEPKAESKTEGNTETKSEPNAPASEGDGENGDNPTLI